MSRKKTNQGQPQRQTERAPTPDEPAAWAEAHREAHREARREQVRSRVRSSLDARILADNARASVPSDPRSDPVGQVIGAVERLIEDVTSPSCADRPARLRRLADYFSARSRSLSLHAEAIGPLGPREDSSVHLDRSSHEAFRSSLQSMGLLSQ
jgi:hypothetical protein